MSIFLPNERCVRITDIRVSHLRDIGVGALILDVDNTLTTHDNPIPGEGVLEWLQNVQNAGIKCIILSNNTAERVTPFAKMLSLDFEADGGKPLTGGVKRACRHMGVTTDETALIGDQIFTDVLAARLSGVYSVLVEPIEPEKTAFFKFKRWAEKPFLKAFDLRKKEH